MNVINLFNNEIVSYSISTTKDVETYTLMD